jgi:hypothetical protein
MRNRPWTEAEESRARQMRVLGHSYTAIGEVLGRSRAAIERKLTGQNRYKLGRACADCGTSICDQNKSGRCRPCNVQHMNADPETKAQRGETVRRKCKADPLYRARKARVAIANKNAAMLDPEKRANMAASWKANLAKAFTPEALAKRAAIFPETMRRRSERQIAWCPVEYRDEYRRLVISKHIKASDARQIILDQIRADEAKLSPFERQERALAKGAQLVANDVKPSLDRPGIYEERRLA